MEFVCLLASRLVSELNPRLNALCQRRPPFLQHRDDTAVHLVHQHCIMQCVGTFLYHCHE